METPPSVQPLGGVFKTLFISKSKVMLELFIELTNQIFWEGYAERLAQENPAAFQLELAEFMNYYNS